MAVMMMMMMMLLTAVMAATFLNTDLLGYPCIIFYNINWGFENLINLPKVHS